MNTTSYDIRISNQESFLNKIKMFLKKCFSTCNKCNECLEKKRKDLMLTPCKHLFHRECLKLWMVNKNDCPVCRFHLPKYKD